jgi:hypothetical protein
MDDLLATTVVTDLANPGRLWACSSYHCAVLSGWVAHLVSMPFQDLYALATATNEATSTERMAPTSIRPEEQRAATDDDVQEFHTEAADLGDGAAYCEAANARTASDFYFGHSRARQWSLAKSRRRLSHTTPSSRTQGSNSVYTKLFKKLVVCRRSVLFTSPFLALSCETSLDPNHVAHESFTA